LATPLLPVEPQETLKSHFKPERSLNEYGGEVATIRDWGVRNSRGQATSIIDNSEDMEVVIELEFHKPCGRPIVGYFLTDAKGREIVGTNTAFEGVRIGERMPGDVLRIRFRQKMAIAPGGYFLNLGCSEDAQGEIVAHHRLYNLTTLTILSNKRFVGFCSLNPQIVVDYPNRITP
jgi:teichoic acid transport system ATP-binding protein